VGQEIERARFEPRDFERFACSLDEETRALGALLEAGGLSARGNVGGLEVEVWLVDAEGLPSPLNEPFLARLANPNVVHELSQFNVELNVQPQCIAGQGLRQLEDDLAATWRSCAAVAGELGVTVMAIGILPTVSDAALCPQNMSTSARYRALNEQVLRLRSGRPIELHLVGAESLRSTHSDVMLEAAGTSLQVHLQVPVAAATRTMNAASIVSAATVAVAANAPFLFGRRLWAETRIPLFEQAVDVGGPERRVTFGSTYVRASLFEMFLENQEHYAPILPIELPPQAGRFAHLRLHNGTVWRWNRPLVGFDDDGTPHLRIEHRPMAAGPTILDMASNMAFFLGLVAWYAQLDAPPERELPFSSAKQNFYEAARLGLAARVDWLDGNRWELRRLVLEALLPLARRGLEQLGVQGAEIERYLGVIEARASKGQTGAAWQCAFVDRHGADFGALVRAYRERSASGAPVHNWDP
jgi:gamma-glutamyl:cysteine ligase YbdK (ATP-grasp superfamily)